MLYLYQNFAITIKQNKISPQGIVMKKFFLFLLLAVFFFPHAFAANIKFSPAKTTTRVNFARKSPVVDGKISPDEYYGSFENFGVLRHNRPFMSSRQGTFYTAMDSKYLYLAMRSELPDKNSNVELSSKYKLRDSKVYSDDNVEFMFVTPANDCIYHLIVNHCNYTYDKKYPLKNGNAQFAKKAEWDPELLVKSSFDSKYWTIEIRVPLTEIGINHKSKPLKMLMQFARTWRNPAEQTALNKVFLFADPKAMNEVVFLPSTSPSVRFITLGSNYADGDQQITFVIDNPTTQEQKVKYSVSVTSEASPRNREGVAVIPAGKSVPVVLAYKEKGKLNNELKAVFINAADNEIIFQRNFNYLLPPGARWIAPDVKSSAELEFGIYPYFNKVRARLGTQSVPCDMRDLESAVMFITDASGKSVSPHYTPEQIKNVGFTAEFPLNLTQKGKYFIVAELTYKNNRKNILKHQFEFEKFAWEHNKLGLDRIVLPPYKPLIYKNNAVKTLMSEYTIKNGLPAAVSSGKAAALLSSPVALTVNGAKPVEKSFKWLEKSDDLGISSSELVCGNLKINIKNEFEFDNFIKTTLAVDPGKGFDFKSMTLDIPLNADFAGQIHSTCNKMRYNFAESLPQKEGEIWNSSMGKRNDNVYNNFRPYIWLGKLGEGMAFFAENDRNWSRDSNKPMAQIFRNGNTVTLRINFIDKAVRRNKPFEIVFGFQATPTRIRPNAGRQYWDRMRGPNTLTSTVFAGSACWASFGFDFFPLNRDYSYINALRDAKLKKRDLKKEIDFVKKYMAKNYGNLPKENFDSFYSHMIRGFMYASISDNMIPYMNPRAAHSRWPEYRVFMDEWYCAPYRANVPDEAYNINATPSYQDFLLHCIDRLLDEGMDGIYYDNIRDWNNPNPVTGPAYILESGNIQPYFDIFDMRKMIKRTAVLLYKKGRTIFDGRPLFVHHMTNTNIVPYSSLCGITLECEDKYGNTDFQTRFSEDYLQIGCLGLQTGAIPEILLQITGNNDWVARTFTAVVTAYDINAVMALSGLPYAPYYPLMRALKTFGYGTDKVTVYPCYEPSGAIKCTQDVRIVEYRHTDGTRIVGISSFGYQGRVKLDFNFAVSSASDFENGTPVALQNGRTVTFELKKHDFKMIKLNK